jgi:hypothetical protein
MRLFNLEGHPFAVVTRTEATVEEARRALPAEDAVGVLVDLFLGADGAEGSMRDALLEMTGDYRFDLFWRRTLAELKEVVACDLREDGRLLMVRVEEPRRLTIVRSLDPPRPVPAAAEKGSAARRQDGTRAAIPHAS